MSVFLRKYIKKFLNQTNSTLNLSENYIIIYNEHKEAVKFMLSDEEDLPEEICQIEAGLINRQGHFIDSSKTEIPSREILDIFQFISEHYHQGGERELAQRATIYKRLVKNTHHLLFEQDDFTHVVKNILENDGTYTFSCTHLLSIKSKDNLRIEIPLDKLEQANYIGYVQLSVEYRDDEINDSTIGILRMPYLELIKSSLLKEFINLPYVNNSDESIVENDLFDDFQQKLCKISSLAQSIELEELLNSKDVKSNKMKI